MAINRLIFIDVDTTQEVTTADAACCDLMVEGTYTLNMACEMAAANGTPIKIWPMKFCPWCGKSFTQSAKDFLAKQAVQ